MVVNCEAPQQRVVIAVDGQHAVARHQLAGLWVDPLVPNAREYPWEPIGPSQVPPDVPAGFPVRLLVSLGRDQATPTFSPRSSEGRGGPHGLSARVVGVPCARC